MKALQEWLRGMSQGRDWSLMGDGGAVRDLLGQVYDERYHRAAHHKDRFQLRVNLQKKDDAASYAGWITAENPTSGPYQGTSFVWFPGAAGSVAALAIGTDGFGADTAILGRPGHARRLRALSRLHRGRIWVKPDLLDIATDVPGVVTKDWPDITAALKAYGRVIYAAVAILNDADRGSVEDLLALGRLGWPLRPHRRRDGCAPRDGRRLFQGHRDRCATGTDPAPAANARRVDVGIPFVPLRPSIPFPSQRPTHAALRTARLRSIARRPSAGTSR